jgi:hypothetical protein
MRIATVSLLLVSLLSTSGTCEAFLPSSPSRAGTYCCMAGGKGWDNADYLGGLGGDEEDRRKAEEDYQDFQERRAAFDERQGEYLKNSPQAQAFLKQQQQQQQNMGNRDDPGDFGDNMQDDFSKLEPGSGGGSRMAQMMAQAKRMQQPQQRNDMFEQKFAPLDDDIEEDAT